MTPQYKSRRFSCSWSISSSDIRFRSRLDASTSVIWQCLHKDATYSIYFNAVPSISERTLKKANAPEYSIALPDKLTNMRVQTVILPIETYMSSSKV